MPREREKQVRLRATAHQPLLYVFVALGSGILTDRALPMTASAWWFVSFTMLAFWLAIRVARLDRVATVALLLAVTATGGCWHHAWWHLFPADHVVRSADDLSRPICLRAEIVSGPVWIPAPPPNPMRTIPRGDSSRMEVCLLEVRDGQTWRPISGRARLTLDGHLLGYSCGDHVTLFARIDVPPTVDTPGEFDFRRHLRGERHLVRLASGFPDCVVLDKVGSTWRADRYLHQVRQHGIASLWRHIPDEQAPLAAAMTLGCREQLDRRDWDLFVETGSVHLLAISGLHVGILALGLYGIGRLLSLRASHTLLVVIAVTLFYAALVELRPPVVRATTIIVVMCVAKLSGRSPLGFNSLAAAGILVLAMNPSDLYRIGPQFSFLAVAVICATTPWFTRTIPEDPLQRLIANTRPWHVRQAKAMAWQIWRLAGTSAAIWLVAMPLVMHYFHICSPSAVVVYPIVAVPITIAMLSGFGVLVLVNLSSTLADACGSVCGTSLWVVDSIVRFVHDLPGAFFWVAGPSLLLVSGFYLVMATYVGIRRGKPSARWPIVLTLMWVSLLTLGGSLADRKEENRETLACTFIDVGHGTSVLLELPGGKNLLYDAGSLGEPSNGERPVASALWSRGIKHLDAVVISHADADHYNALPRLLDRFSVGAVYVSPVMFEDDAKALNSLKESIESRGISLREVFASDRIGEGPASIEVLHPPRRGVLGDDNANSIVLDIEFMGKRLLLPGDLESPGIDDVMAEEPRGYDLVMAPHHGSSGSKPEGFSEWTRPSVVVISGGRGRETNTVRAAFANVGARALHTAEDGSIRVEIDSDGMRTLSYRRAEW